jgi:hypothetical protein
MNGQQIEMATLIRGRCDRFLLCAPVFNVPATLCTRSRTVQIWARSGLLVANCVLCFAPDWGHSDNDGETKQRGTLVNPTSDSI